MQRSTTTQTERPSRMAERVFFDEVMGTFKIDGEVIPWFLSEESGFHVEKVEGFENPPLFHVTVTFQVSGEVFTGHVGQCK